MNGKDLDNSRLRSSLKSPVDEEPVVINGIRISDDMIGELGEPLPSKKVNIVPKNKTTPIIRKNPVASKQSKSVKDFPDETFPLSDNESPKIDKKNNDKLSNLINMNLSDDSDEAENSDEGNIDNHLDEILKGKNDIDRFFDSEDEAGEDEAGEDEVGDNFITDNEIQNEKVETNNLQYDINLNKKLDNISAERLRVNISPTPLSPVIPASIVNVDTKVKNSILSVKNLTNRQSSTVKSDTSSPLSSSPKINPTLKSLSGFESVSPAPVTKDKKIVSNNRRGAPSPPATTVVVKPIPRKSTTSAASAAKQQMIKQTSILKDMKTSNEKNSPRGFSPTGHSPKGGSPEYEEAIRSAIQSPERSPLHAVKPRIYKNQNAQVVIPDRKQQVKKDPELLKTQPTRVYQRKNASDPQIDKIEQYSPPRSTYNITTPSRMGPATPSPTLKNLSSAFSPKINSTKRSNKYDDDDDIDFVQLPDKFVPLPTAVAYVSSFDTHFGMKPDFEHMSDIDRHAFLIDMVTALENLYKGYDHVKFETIDTSDRSVAKLEMLYKSWTRLDKKEKIEARVQQYRVYLLVYFFLLELICTYVLKLDADKFTEKQWKNVHIYDKAIYQLADQTMEGFSEGWPPLVVIGVYGVGYLAVYIFFNFLSSMVGDTMANGLQDMLTDYMWGNNVENSGGGGGIATLLSSITKIINNKQKKDDGKKTDEKGRARPKYTE